MIDQFLDEKFAPYPKTSDFIDLKTSLSDDLHDLANEKIAAGMSQKDAENEVLKRLGNLDDLLESLGAVQPNYARQFASYQKFYNTINQLEMVNKYQVDLNGIDEIHFNYRVGGIVVIPSPSDKIIVHEYMSRKVSGLYSTPSKIGNVLNINQGPKRLIGLLRGRIEISIPNEFKGFISFNVNGSKISFNNIKSEYLLDLTGKSTNVKAFNLHAKKIQLDLGSGNLSARHILANDISINAKSGNIKLDDVKVPQDGKQMLISDDNGNLDLHNIASPSFSLKLRNGNAKINSLIASEFIANSTSGNLQIDNLTAQTDVTSNSGWITLDNFIPTANSNFMVKSGNVKIQLENPSDLQFDLQTKNGRMQLPANAKIVDFSNHKIVGLIGVKPEITITAKSSSGNLKIN